MDLRLIILQKQAPRRPQPTTPPEGAGQALEIASSHNLTLEERQLGLDHFFNIFPDTHQDQVNYMDFSGATIANIRGLPSDAPLVLEGTKLGGGN